VLSKAGKLFVRYFLLSENFVLYLSVLYFVALSLFIPHMASGRNLTNVSSNMWPLFALVVGQMFVLIVGGLDLSQTSIMAFVSVIGAMLMTSELDPALFENNILWGTLLAETGGPLGGSVLATPVGIIVMLIVGALVGLVNGVSVAKLKMPPFMVTLISMMFFGGLAIFATRSENIMHLPASFVAVGRGQVGLIPYSFFIALILATGTHYILRHTVLGQWFYSVGKNVRTSMVSGVPTQKVIIIAYIFSGFCAGVASVLYSARLEAGRPTLGQNLLLDVIGAAVIGGISLYGGKGKVHWALFGVLFFALLANSLNMMNLSFFTVQIVKGIIILMAAAIDVTRNRLIIRDIV